MTRVTRGMRLGAAVALVLFAVTGGAVPMGARGVAWGGLTRNPYVTDGLVAMWDAQWNVDWGVHSSTTAIWKDLSGNGFDATVNYSAAEFGDNAIIYNGRTGTSLRYGIAYGSSAIGIHGNNNYYEFVVSSESVMQNNGFALFHCGGMLDGWSSGVVMMYYWSQYSRGGVCVGNPATLYKTDPAYTFSGIAQYALDHNFLAKNGVVSTGSPSFTDVNVTKNYTMNFFALVPGTTTSGWYTTFPRGFSIYSFRVYSRRLTDSERLANYAVDKARFGLP